MLAFFETVLSFVCSPGQFGEVFRAHYCPDGCVGESTTVAVKKTKDDCPEKEKQSILKEMEVMAKTVHPNIVKLYGVVTQGGRIPGAGPVRHGSGYSFDLIITKSSLST